MAKTLDVKSLYESHPYPSPEASDPVPGVADLIESWFPDDDFSGKKILEAGCGAGHRLAGVGKRFPKAEILGIDITKASLEVGKNLVKKHNINNVAFEEADLLTLNLTDKYDLIICTGVIHHTENPAKSLQNICDVLTEDGIACVWVYHPFGEHQRLIEREILFRFLGNKWRDHTTGIDLMNELSFDLDPAQYSGDEHIPEGQKEKSTSSGISKNVDAYLNPIVNSYRVEKALELFSFSNVNWTAVEAFSYLGVSKFIDLSNTVDES